MRLKILFVLLVISPASSAWLALPAFWQSGNTPGQAAYTAVGSYTFVVPVGITNISVVAIGGGGSGIQFGGTVCGGGGGALSYKNGITVTPGQHITVSVGAAGAPSLFGGFLNTGGGAPGSSVSSPGGAKDGTATGGGNGGAGSCGFGGSWPGGSAGLYTGTGAVGGGTGTGIKGPGSSPTYGAGGTSIYSGSPTPGVSGAVRIIWGPGRSFPSTNVTDM